MRTLIHDPTDNEISFTKKFQSFKNFRTIIPFTCSKTMFLTPCKKKKLGKAFHSDHFLKRMLFSNIRLVLCDLM